MKNTIPVRFLHYLFFISFLGGSLTTLAQPREEIVKVIVAPDHDDWTYKVGEEVKFTISVLQYGNLLKNVEVRYEVKPEKMQPIKSDKQILKNGEVNIKAGTMQQPGFLRCWAYATVDGKEYTGYATAGFDPQDIQPTTTEPDDFTEFWDKAKAEAAKVPLDAQLTLLPERCTETVNVYHVNVQNYQPGTRMYGILCVPKKEGKYPAILEVPGAGARPYYGDVDLAKEGVITLQIGIHGVSVTMDPEVYNNMMRGPIAGYWEYNLDDRDRYYYKRVYLGCVRAVDYIFSLPEFDGENLAVKGGSQGGALSIVTAGLDDRIKWLAPFYPALSDLTGYLEGRAGGWPHLFAEQNKDFNVKDDKIETSKYYDVVNFARHVKVPGYYSWGYNDNVCPPTSMYAAYNVITADKQLLLAQDTGHWTYPEQHEKTNKWLLEQLLPGKGSMGK